MGGLGDEWRVSVDSGQPSPCGGGGPACEVRRVGSVGRLGFPGAGEAGEEPGRPRHARVEAVVFGQSSMDSSMSITGMPSSTT